MALREPELSRWNLGLGVAKLALWGLSVANSRLDAMLLQRRHQPSQLTCSAELEWATVAASSAMNGIAAIFVQNIESSRAWTCGARARRDTRESSRG